MKEKKNISVLTIDYGAGGAERVISLLLKEMVKDFNVTLVIFYDYVDYDIPEGVELVVLLPKGDRINTLYRKAKDTMLVSNKYSRLIKEKSIDVSLSFLALPNIINGIVGKRNKQLRTVISERCFPSIMYTANRSSNFLAKYVFPVYYPKNDHLFSNSEYINIDLKENFKVNMPMSVVYNPIEIDDSHIKSVDSITPTSQLNIINVGTIYEPKNQKLIISALSKLDKEEYNLTILGVGELEDETKAYTNELGLDDNVNFKGKVNNVKDYLIESDCFVLSSNTEGFPNVVLEAMAAGLPVISTNCMSGPLELLNDNEPVSISDGAFYEAKYGILINVGDAEALAKALTYYKENPEVRKRYSEVGFERAKENSLPNIYKQVKELLIH